MKRIIGGLALFGVLLAGGALLFGTGDSARYTYEGKEVFQTAREYNTFKEVVGVPEIGLEEILVLSSEPPIVVQFNLLAPKGIDCPYGDRSTLPKGLPFAFLFGGGIALVGVALLFGLVELWDR